MNIKTLDIINIKPIIDIYQTQAKLVDRIWAYFSTTTLAVLGFTIGNKTVIASHHAQVIIAISYIVFAIGSSISLAKGQKDLHTFSALLPNKLVSPLSVRAVIFFHLLVVIAVIAVIGLNFLPQAILDFFK